MSQFRPYARAGKVMVTGSLLALGFASSSARAALDGDDAPSAAAVVSDDFAQLSLEDLLSLSTVTVSGGSAESRAAAAGNVVVVTRRMIADNGWSSVADVLANVPGLYVIDDGSLVSVGIRGVTGGLRAGTRLIKIMINGVPVNFRPDVRAFIGPEYIPIDAVEQIEVVKGPLSALYGAEAFLATVNVITRQPENGTVADLSARAISSNGGHFGRGVSGAILYGEGSVRLVLSVTSYNVDHSGLSIQRTFSAQDPSADRFVPFFAGPSQSDVATPVGGFAQLSLRGDRLGTLSVDAGLQRLDAVSEFQLNSVLTHQSRESIQNVWSTVTHEKSWANRFKTHITLGAATGAPTRDDQLYLTDNFTRVYTRNFGYKSGTASFAGTYTHGTRFSARMGVDVEVQRQRILYFTQTFHDTQGMRLPGDRVDLIGPEVSRVQPMSDVGVHAQLSVVPIARLPDLQLSGNIRADRVFYGSFDPPPQASARVALVNFWRPGVVVKLIAGRAFQAPSGVLMFAQPGFGATNNVIGSLTSFSTVTAPLRPQTVSSVEAITYVLLGDNLSLDVAGFYQRITDRIEFQTTGSDYVAHNAGDASYAGGEASIKATVRFVVPFVDASYVRSLSSTQSDVNPLTAYPALSGSAGFDADVPRVPVHLNLRARYVGARAATFGNTLFNFNQPYTLPAYVTVDATILSNDFHLLGPRATTRLSLTGRNILDHRHSEPGFGGFDVPIQGRTLLLGIQQSL
jgi:outer membrane receptor protein involved in Fe transport